MQSASVSAWVLLGLILLWLALVVLRGFAVWSFSWWFLTAPPLIVMLLVLYAISSWLKQSQP